MGPVAGIGPLWTIAGKELAIELKARHMRHHRYTILLSRAWIDRRLIDHHSALGDGPTHGPAGRQKSRQIRPLLSVNRCRHSDDEDITGLQRRLFSRKAKARGGH